MPREILQNYPHKETHSVSPWKPNQKLINQNPKQLNFYFRCITLKL